MSRNTNSFFSFFGTDPCDTARKYYLELINAEAYTKCLSGTAGYTYGRGLKPYSGYHNGVDNPNLDASAECRAAFEQAQRAHTAWEYCGLKK